MRRYYIFINLIFLVLGYWLNSIYRPYIYHSQIEDLGLADVGNNLVFVPGIYFLLLSIRNEPMLSYIYDILLIWSIYMFIEAIQFISFIPGTFDWKDMSALTVGAMIAFLINNYLHKSDFHNINSQFKGE